jgi:hypothetical protein
MAMMGHVLHLVEGARIEENESKYPTNPLVEPSSAENGSMAQLVLPCVKEIEKRAVDQ